MGRSLGWEQPRQAAQDRVRSGGGSGNSSRGGQGPPRAPAPAPGSGNSSRGRGRGWTVAGRSLPHVRSRPLCPYLPPFAPSLQAQDMAVHVPNAGSGAGAASGSGRQGPQDALEKARYGAVPRRRRWRKRQARPRPPEGEWEAGAAGRPRKSKIWSGPAAPALAQKAGAAAAPGGGVGGRGRRGRAGGARRAKASPGSSVVRRSEAGEEALPASPVRRVRMGGETMYYMSGGRG